MSNRILKEKSGNQQNKLNELSEIQESDIESINDKITHDEKISLSSNGKFNEFSNQITGNQISSVDIANTLSSIFGEPVKGTFEIYRRTGKFFFRCEHDEGKGYSQLIGNLLKILIEENMKKSKIHYIITPRSASAVFR